MDVYSSKSQKNLDSTDTREKLTDDFYRDEFACRCGCGEDSINLHLVYRLQKVRDEIGGPIKITSGCRCAKHNEVEGGNPFSAHLSGDAADISCAHSNKRMTLLPVLCRFFRRVGVGDSFVHVDIDPTKDQDVLWVYS